MTGIQPLIRTVSTGILLCMGCTTVPFDPVPRMPVASSSADCAAALVRASFPKCFTVLSSVTFRYRGRSKTALCCTEVNADAGTFTAAGMTPLGMNLFEIRGTPAGVESVFMAPELDHQFNPAEYIGADIRKVYLDPLPVQATLNTRKTDGYIFAQPVQDGRLEYEIGGRPWVLIEKRRTDSRGLVWRVRYYEYAEASGAWFPEGVVVDHKRYGYRLIIRLKEILDPAARIQNPK